MVAIWSVLVVEVLSEVQGLCGVIFDVWQKLQTYQAGLLGVVYVEVKVKNLRQLELLQQDLGLPRQKIWR